MRLRTQWDRQREIEREAERLNARFERAQKEWQTAKDAAEHRHEEFAAKAYDARRVGALVCILGTWVAVDQVDTVTDHSWPGGAPDRAFPGLEGWHSWSVFGASLPAISSTMRLRSGEELTFPLTADVVAEVLATREDDPRGKAAH